MKRFLGFVLALSMIIAMIPAVAAEETGLTLMYNVDDIMTEQGMFKTWGDYSKTLDVLTYDLTKGSFKWYGYEGELIYGNQIVFRKDIEFYKTVQPAFEVYIPRKGSYKMNITHSLSKTGNEVTVFASKDGISTASADKFGTYTSYKSGDDGFSAGISTTDTLKKEAEVAILEVSEPCTYVFTFSLGGGWGSIGNFELVDITESASSDAVLMRPILDISGGKAQVTGLWDSDGASVSLDGAEITYASSNQDIATIDATTGVITDKAVGTTDITATVTINGATITATEKYTVTDGITIKYAVQDTMKALKMITGASETPLANLSYANTNGFFEFYEFYSYNSDTIGIVENPTHGYNSDHIQYTDEGVLRFYRGHMAFKVYIPRAGEYTLKHYNGGMGSAWTEDAAVYVNKTSASIEEADKIGTYSGAGTTLNQVVATPAVMSKKISVKEPGEYIITFYCYKHNSIGNFELVDGLGTMVVPMSVKLNVANDTAEISKVVMSDGTTTADGATVTYTSSNTDVATIDAQSGAITKVREGKTDITVSVTRGDVTVTDTVAYTVEADTELKDAFDAEPTVEEDYIAPSVTGIIEDDVITAQPNADGSYNLTAPDADAENKFLYWAMGMGTNKRIVSFDATLKNYVPQGNNVNYLVPVYEDDITDKETPEYYNINGELIAKQAPVPTIMPSIPGLGKAKGWVNCGGNIWVAEYESTTPKNVTVTVENDNGTDTYAYGGLVTCTANADNFKCWKKTVGNSTEIVSVDPTYTFRAWEDCTVTAVYKEHIPVATAMKIIIDDFDIDGDTGDTGVMAEFIGLGNAVEKGIMFTATGETEARKIAMTTKDNQFTVVADKPGTYVGYAIFKSGDVYNIITDGSYTK